MTDVQWVAMMADLVAFDLKYAAYKCPLEPAQIRGLAKLGPSDLGLLRMALTYAQQNPTLVPANVNLVQGL